jgi:hypothetical protein
MFFSAPSEGLAPFDGHAPRTLHPTRHPGRGSCIAELRRGRTHGGGPASVWGRPWLLVGLGVRPPLAKRRAHSIRCAALQHVVCLQSSEENGGAVLGLEDIATKYSFDAKKQAGTKVCCRS